MESKKIASSYRLSSILQIRPFQRLVEEWKKKAKLSPSPTNSNVKTVFENWSIRRLYIKIGFLLGPLSFLLDQKSSDNRGGCVFRL